MKPKKLNLSEIWKVYQLLRPAIEGKTFDGTVLDEVLDIIDVSTPEALLACVNIMYDNKARFSNPMEFNTLFINGLSTNDFFSFCVNMGVLSGSTRK